MVIYSIYSITYLTCIRLKVYLTNIKNLCLPPLPRITKQEASSFKYTRYTTKQECIANNTSKLSCCSNCSYLIVLQFPFSFKVCIFTNKLSTQPHTKNYETDTHITQNLIFRLNNLGKIVIFSVKYMNHEWRLSHDWSKGLKRYELWSCYDEIKLKSMKFFHKISMANSSPLGLICMKSSPNVPQYFNELYMESNYKFMTSFKKKKNKRINQLWVIIFYCKKYFDLHKPIEI